MEYSYIIILYILHVFIARWLNKLVYNLDNTVPIFWSFWFIPIWGILFYGIGYIIITPTPKFKKNWFTGKYW